MCTAAPVKPRTSRRSRRRCRRVPKRRRGHTTLERLVWGARLGMRLERSAIEPEPEFGAPHDAAALALTPALREYAVYCSLGRGTLSAMPAVVLERGVGTLAHVALEDGDSLAASHMDRRCDLPQLVDESV